MSLYYPKDYDLSPIELQVRHEGKGGHPGYPQRVWRSEVELQNTLRGYWDWVRAQLEEEREELDTCNPVCP